MTKQYSMGLSEKCYNVGLYLRLSIEDAHNSQKRGKVNPFQNDSSSIENQRVLLAEYVNIQGWNLTQTYTDDGYSGATFDKRPAFQQMIQDAEAGLIDLILVKDLSRFGRDYIETGRYTDEVFPSLGVRFIALMDNIDSEGNDDLLPFRSILNDYHLKDLSRKVKSALKAMAVNGEYIGAVAPYGFVKDPTDKHRLLVDDYAAGVVRKIFDLRATGMGYASIAATLNNEGILSPKTYRSNLAGETCPGKKWISCVVIDIINNEAYIGHSVRFKTGHISYKNRKVVNKPTDEHIRCENVFPPIISIEVWDAAQKASVKNARPRPSLPREKSLFNKLLRCADCGSPLVRKKSYSKSRITGETKVGHAYFCSKFHQTGGSVCSRHTIREHILLSIIKEDIAKQFESVGFDESRIANEIHRQFSGASLGEAKKRLGHLAERITELSTLGRKLYEDRLKGIISIDTFKKLSEEAEVEKESVKAEHGRLSELITSEERRALEMESIIPKLREFLTLENVTNETLSALIDHVVVNESVGRSMYRTHDVKIVYRFERLG